MAAYVAAIAAARPAVNVAALVGHSTLRVATMDDPYRPATPAEQSRMCELLREGLAAGAAGLSSGVFYATGAAADIDELALLAGIAGDAGGVYTTHIRQEMDKVLESLDEAFATARRGQVALVVSHHKCAGPRNWGRTVETLAHIDAARRASRSARTAIRTSPARRCCAANGRRHHRHPHHLVDAAPGNGGADARQHRRGMGLQPGGSLRAPAARRRVLLPDARGRRPARPAHPAP
jgi:N-acyl-D-aspartate/D-glutamate deacylase